MEDAMSLGSGASAAEEMTSGGSFGLSAGLTGKRGLVLNPLVEEASVAADDEAELGEMDDFDLLSFLLDEACLSKRFFRALIPEAGLLLMGLDLSCSCSSFSSSA